MPNPADPRIGSLRYAAGSAKNAGQDPCTRHRRPRACCLAPARDIGVQQRVPLSEVCEVRVSNVDKKSEPGELPVRLCNYTDVYKNDYITDDLEFMRATASRAEIAKFGLHVGDVIITKDSETPDDIGIPALVDSTSSDLLCGYHLAMIRPAPNTGGRSRYGTLILITHLRTTSSSSINSRSN
jgi:hypothetical protein